MVDRRTDDRQAQGHVDCSAEAFVLEYRQALVVVHRQHRVAVLQIFGGKQGIGRQRPAQVHAFGAQAGQGRLDDVDFLAAQVAALARVRVKATHQYARVGNAELVAHVGMQDTGYTFDALGSDGVGNITQRQVGGHQGHAQAAGGQHHYHLRGVGQLGKEFGMP